MNLTLVEPHSQATEQSLPVSVLDLVATRIGENASSAIARSVELAQHAEQLGYKRHEVNARTSRRLLSFSFSHLLDFITWEGVMSRAVTVSWGPSGLGQSISVGPHQLLADETVHS